MRFLIFRQILFLHPSFRRDPVSPRKFRGARTLGPIPLRLSPTGSGFNPSADECQTRLHAALLFARRALRFALDRAARSPASVCWAGMPRSAQNALNRSRNASCQHRLRCERLAFMSSTRSKERLRNAPFG
jgi:hypothetical protein